MAVDRRFPTKTAARKYMKSKSKGVARDGHIRQLKKTRMGWTVYRN